MRLEVGRAGDILGVGWHVLELRYLKRWVDGGVKPMTKVKGNRSEADDGAHPLS